MSGTSRRSPWFYLVGVIVVGFIAWWALKLVLALAFYVIVGVIVVGLALYVTGKGRRALGRGKRRKIGR